MDIADFIPRGKENAVTREMLSTRLALPDRRVRKLIEAARDRGELICNDGTGYFITDNIGDIERQYRKDRARALSTLKRLKTMRRVLREHGRDVR